MELQQESHSFEKNTSGFIGLLCQMFAQLAIICSKLLGKMVYCIWMRISQKAWRQHGKQSPMEKMLEMLESACTWVWSPVAPVHSMFVSTTPWRCSWIVLISKPRQYAHICEGYSEQQTLDGFFRCVAVWRHYIASQPNLRCYFEQLHAQATILLNHCLPQSPLYSLPERPTSARQEQERLLGGFCIEPQPDLWCRQLPSWSCHSLGHALRLLVNTRRDLGVDSDLRSCLMAPCQSPISCMISGQAFVDQAHHRAQLAVVSFQFSYVSTCQTPALLVRFQWTFLL